MSDATDAKKRKFKLDPMKSPSSFGAFGGMFIVQGIISLCWAVTKNNYEFKSMTADTVTALSTQEIAGSMVNLYGLICIIGGILLCGVDHILETLKPSGRKLTVKGWFYSILGAAFISGALFLPFFIIFSIIKH